MQSHKLNSQIRKKKSLSVQKTHRLHPPRGSERERTWQESRDVGVPSLREHSACVQSARVCYQGNEGAAPFPVPSSGPAFPASCILIRPQQPGILLHARTVPDGPRASGLCKLRLGAGLPDAHPTQEQRVPPRCPQPQRTGLEAAPGAEG